MSVVTQGLTSTGYLSKNYSNINKLIIVKYYCDCYCIEL